MVKIRLRRLAVSELRRQLSVWAVQCGIAAGAEPVGSGDDSAGVPHRHSSVSTAERLCGAQW